MEIQIVGADKTDVQELEDRDLNNPSSVTGDNAGEISKIAVRQVLDIESGKNDKEVDTLVKWATNKVGTDPQEIKWAIRDLKLRIGTPPFGDAIKNLARFAYLDIEEKKIKEEKQKFSKY